MKVSVIGAGYVGGEVANRVAFEKLSDSVVIVDIDKELALAKAQDISHGINIYDFNCEVIGTDNNERIKDSDIIVITAGSARKPGMSRNDLAESNQKVMRSISKNIKKFAPHSIVLVVTNPVDLMTYFVKSYTGFNRERVIGMAGVLDSGRLKYIISGRQEVNERKKVDGLVIGPHGNSMICLPEYITIGDEKILDYFSEEEISDIFKEVSHTGSKLVSLYGGNSAFFGPSAGISKLIRMIKENSNEIIPCSVLLKGEYEIQGLCLGVPVQLSSRGVKEVKEIELKLEEKEKLVEIAKEYKNKINFLKKDS